MYTNFMVEKFVYSMITFNIIYDKYSGDCVWEKIVELVNNIFYNSENLKKFYLYFMEFNKFLKDEKLGSIRHIVDDSNIKKINNSDKNIPKRTYKISFIDSFKNMINNERVTKQEVLLMLLYINQIRNNLFHGSKDIEHTIESTQNKRLKIYIRI